MKSGLRITLGQPQLPHLYHVAATTYGVDNLDSWFNERKTPGLSFVSH